jgi:hypothetical protein
MNAKRIAVVALLFCLTVAALAQEPAVPQPATVVFYGLPAPAVRMPLRADGQTVCGKGVNGGQYCTVTLPPGSHEFTADRAKHGGRRTLEAGQTYYFFVALTMWSITLRPASAEEALFAISTLHPQKA